MEASGGGRGIFRCLTWIVAILFMIDEVQSFPRPFRQAQVPNRRAQVGPIRRAHVPNRRPQVGPFRRAAPVGETIFDITTFGAKGDGKTDDSLAIITAWTEACHSKGAARLLIPRRQFVAAEVVLAGPCTAAPLTVEIQGSLLAYTDISSYTNGAWIMVERVNGIVITGGGTIDGRGPEVWKYSDGGPPLPVSLVFQTVSNAQMNNLNFVNSMGFHLKVTDSNNINISQMRITAPGTSPNTDGCHMSSSTNVNFTDSVIGTGDDCISIGHGNSNILVARVTCGPGHGISIGSLGKRLDETNVQGVTVINCTIIGTTNGVRIKTYRNSPSLLASAIYFQDIVMKQVQNPIIIDQNYQSRKKPQPSKVKLNDVHFRNIWGTTISPKAINLNCSSVAPCERVELSNINLTPFGPVGPLTSACSNAKYFVTGRLNPPTLARCV